LVLSRDKNGAAAEFADQPEALRNIPVFVRSAGPVSPGLAALLDQGARLWPEPRDLQAFKAVLDGAMPAPWSS
ncbi:hypothetical protein, partial [Acinetobacter baumannii]|uniref:hypothetical protein n=1 Tax=Acinetobacter baumannii TaxID=470 RepID=UPI001D180227